MSKKQLIMVKKLTFSIVFLLNLFCATVFADTNERYSENLVTKITQCTAPPPDNFRITDISNNTVSLAWDPISLGDNHQLIILQESYPGDWVLLYSVNLQNAKSYTLTDFESDKTYKVGISTICQDGTPGDSVSYSLPFQGVIIDLTLEGRRPINPTPISCNNIDFSDPNNKWIGFNLSKIENNIVVKNSLFEIERRASAHFLVKRVEVDNPIVSANADKIWPIQTAPIASQFTPTFYVGEVNSSNIFVDFGTVDIELPTSNVNICALIYNSSYKYEILTAKEVEKCRSCPPTGNPGSPGLPGNPGTGGKTGGVDINVQNPFSDRLDISLFTSRSQKLIFHVFLLGLDEKLYYQGEITNEESGLYIDTQYIPKGFYILHIEGDGFVENVKIVKM